MSVYEHQEKWRWEFWMNNQRHSKSGYPSKQSAQTAELEARKRIKEINTDFIKLLQSRSDELVNKRSTSHANENKSLFDKLINVYGWGTKKEITKQDVIEYLDIVAKESSSKSNKHLRLIRALFNHGIYMEWFTYNPAKNIKPYPIKKTPKYIPSKNDVIAVLRVANFLDRLYLLMLIHTLARVREINNLKWTDIHDDHLILSTCKSNDSDTISRNIPINSVLRIVLDEIPKKGEYLFVNPTNNNLPYDYRDKFLTTLCEKAGVQRFTFHCLRHFGASSLSSAGTGTNDIQALLGHSRASTTDLYLQSIHKSTVFAMQHLEEIK